MNDKALIKFQIGPVQPFIAAARTIRDLWTGSYLLSWLVVVAMREARTQGANVISPNIEGNPILDHDRSLKVLTPCLPNHFEAEVEEGRAQQVADACVTACREEWRNIANKVLDRLKQKFPQLDRNWNRDWEKQIETYFEMVCVILPASTEAASVRREQLHQLMDARRSVRHTPNYVPSADEKGRYGMKCSVLGTFEQVGPADYQAVSAFWETLTSQGVDGTHLRERERFCAVSLVKRFAWPAYLAEEVQQPKNELRYSDTATVAARLWLNGAKINPDEVRRQYREGWNGQWLHWPKNPPEKAERERGVEKCPADVWKKIEDARNKQKPPAYYAVLMCDGDNVGSLLKKDENNTITRRLAHFALHEVQPIVEGANDGELIYAGGDDVLAVMPTATALSCAQALYQSYRSKEVMGDDPMGTMSAGLVIAHYKEDLRYVLERARAAEKEAKNAGRNQLVLHVLSRSGEHTSAVLPWTVVSDFQLLVQKYLDVGKDPPSPGSAKKPSPPSDRWAYKLRADLPVLAQSTEMFVAEMTRRLNRLELPRERREAFRTFILDFFEKVRAKLPGENLPGNFVTICQSASFLARGRDE